MRRVLWFLCLICGAARATAQPSLPAGFDDALVASVASPTSLAFTPDGRILITTQSGKLRIVRNGALVASAALDLASVLCTDSERGLLGVAVDPAFASNRTIYLYYTYKKSGVCERNTSKAPVNRVSRFVLSDTDVASRTSEVVLVDNIPSPNGNHNGGDLHFGRDGFLYISIGDGGCDYLANSGCAGANDASRDSNVLLGKILRITRDGAIPSSNPFRGTNSVRCNVTGRGAPGQVCQETFASGLRNPFRIAFDPNAGGTRFFINDVGQNVWEEINLGEAGADYGWNTREGHCANNSTTSCGAPPGGLTNPIYDYAHSGGCAAITGGAFVPNGAWPPAYDNSYFYADYVCGAIYQLIEQMDGTFKRTPFATGLGNSSAVALIFGPAGSGTALYYTSYANGGEIRRIARAGNRAPRAAASGTPVTGPTPLTVRFSGDTSSDPDGDALTFDWNFGDGTAHASTASASHIYQTAGRYSAVLTVKDSHGATGTATVVVNAGDRPPQASILAPSATALFSVGQTIMLQGLATDPEDGTLPAASLSWRVLLHHNTHTHPYAGPVTGSTLTISAPAPEDLAATTTSYLELELTATDRAGATTVVRQNMQPRRVTVSFATTPNGAALVINATTITAPRQLTSWAGYQLHVSAPDYTDGAGSLQAFSSWSDGGASAHTIVTPATAASYTATFTRGHRFAPSADTFVRGGIYAAKSFGTASAIEVKLGSTDNLREAFLRFGIAATPTVGRARLRIYGALTDTRSSNIPLIALAVPVTTWSETALTWNTRPGRGAQLARATILDATARWYEFDVTSYVRSEKVAGRQVVSFALDAGATSSPHLAFNSREAASNRPELVVGESAAVPADVVLYSSDAAVIKGAWQRVNDSQAAGGARLSNPDALKPKLSEAAVSPTDYFEMTFTADAGRPYRLWIRGKAAGDSFANDSAYVQFSGTVTASGGATMRIGTSSALTYVLEDCKGCGVEGWGWQDNGYGTNVLGPEIQFATSGPQRLRIQAREDGLSIDQVVLSPSRYLTRRPGLAKADGTIVPK